MSTFTQHEKNLNKLISLDVNLSEHDMDYYDSWNADSLVCIVKEVTTHLEEVVAEKEKSLARVKELEAFILDTVSQSKGVSGYFLYGENATWKEVGLGDIFSKHPRICLIKGKHYET